MHLEPVPSTFLARRRAAVAARIDRIEVDLSRVTRGAFPRAVRCLLAELEQELAEIRAATLDEDARAGVLVRQHATLRRDLDTIADLLAPPELGSVEQQAAAVLLRDLERELVAHLDFEERALAGALADAGRWPRRAETLLAEHAALREATSALIVAAEAAVAEASGWRRIRAAYVELHERVLAHERAEAALVHSLYLEDLGGSG
jgi:hypothetical protein